MSAPDTTTTRTEARTLLTIGAPLIVNNLSVAGMQFADAVMAGRLGAKSLAATAVGGSIWFLGFSVVLGIMMAISPIVARHFGANDKELIGRYTRQGLYLGLALGVPAILVYHAAIGPVTEVVGIHDEFRGATIDYVRAIAWGAPGIYMFLALRFTTEGLGITRPLAYVSVLALCVNVFLNYVLAFGNFGAPALGVVGLAYASAITMWLICAVLATYMFVSPSYTPYRLFSRVAPVRLAVFREVLLLGLPIAMMLTAEVGLFSAISVLMGTRGAAITAAHQIALNFASTAFMIPLALSAAITVRVGQLLGRGRPASARRAGLTGIAMCALFMTVSAVFLLVFRDLVVSLYTRDPVVTGIAVSLLLVAAIFQVADGVQIGAAGALRGYKDTRVPMLINTFAFWMLGFPLAYLATVTFVLSPSYIWAGFVLGLGVAALLLSWRFAALSRRLATP